MTRPYFHNALRDLQDLFANNQDDPKILIGLYNELAHRNRPGARALSEKVRSQLKKFAQKTNATGPAEGTVDHPLPSEDWRQRDKDQSNEKSETATENIGGAHREHGSFRADIHLQRPQRLKRIEPLGTSGKPPKYVRNLKTDVVLENRPDMSRAERYAVALGALVTDMRRQKHSNRQIVLEDGKRVNLDRGHFGYTFAFAEDAELFEDARVEIRIGSRMVDGQVVSITDGRIIIAVEEDFGEMIARCTLLVDNTALLDALKEHLEKAGKEGRSLNTKLADDVVTNGGQAFPPDQSSLDGSRLNERQLYAVRLALANEVTYIWGPPGTGKTTTISVLVKELFSRSKRVLICSNTNKAVDQVLLSLCYELGEDHPAMQQGKILRLGRIVHEQLKKYAEFVSLDGIVERRSRDLKALKSKLESALAEISRRAAAVEGTLARIVECENARAASQQAEREAVRYGTDRQGAVQKRDTAEKRLDGLNHELDRVKSAGAFRRAFLRSESAISADIEMMTRVMTFKDAEAERLLRFSKAAEEKATQLAAKADELGHALGNADRAALQKQLDAYSAERQPLLNELATVNKALGDIEASVMQDAAIIGATVTKSYLSANNLPSFDVVVVDEASMVLLPALYFAVGLGREKAVISGDFRQLPPIIQTEQKTILDEIGTDVFHAAGLDVDSRQNDPRLVQLQVQHRMHKSICNLISGFMYRGNLQTSAEVEARPDKARDPIAGPLTVIDTSSLWPFETQTATFSRYNLIHALVVRNVIRQMHKAGELTDDASLGICTPYAAQAKLIRRLIEDEDEIKGLVEAGTVHRYQGDERTAIVIDIPESVGGARFIGRFLQGDNPEDDGSKLLNVAVSRAREHLLIIANLTYLDDRLPSSALLRHILFEMQSKGQVLDARNILTLSPADLRGLGDTINIDIETQRTGLFGQKDFDLAFRADIQMARKSIVIFSGFVTPERVGSYGDLFRQKILDGAKIRCVTRPPQFNGSIPVALGKEALDALEGIGVSVDCRRDVHQKLVIMDGRVVWLGSLNPLSHTTKTDEVMIRTVAPHFAAELARQISIQGRHRDDDAEMAGVQTENPRCGICGGRTYYFFSRRLNRPFFACEGNCNWVRDAAGSGFQQRSQRPDDDLPPEGPPCPKCGNKTRRRQGRHGTFYGCSRYPKCDGTINLKDTLKVASADAVPETNGRSQHPLVDLL